MADPAAPAAATYAAQAQGAGTNLSAMLTLAKTFADLTEGEKATITALQAEKALWPKAAKAVDTAGRMFKQSSDALLTGWRSRVESKTYEQATLRSGQSLADMSSQLTGTPAGGPSASSGNLDQLIDPLAADIPKVADQAKQLAAQLQQLQNDMNFTEGTATSPLLETALKGHSANLITVGTNMDNISQRYIQVGTTAKSMAAAMKWQGPHSDVSGGDLNRSPGTGPGGPSGGPSGSPSDQPGGDQPGGEQPGGEQPGGEQPGGEQAGGDEAGGDTGEQTGPGGTELQGTATVPKPLAPIGSVGSIGGVDASPGTPMTPMTPFTPIATGRGITGGGLPGRGIGSGVGGIGGGVGGGIGSIGGGGAGGSKLDGIKPLSKVDQIPSVAKTGTAESVASTGRAPSLPGVGTGTAGGSAQGGAGIPPMMPPMGGAAGAGGGRGGKPGTGAIRPTGRERGRATGPTPGVPDRLRGKAGQRAAFPSVPAAKSTAARQDRPETLEILDEELWTVETAPEATAADPQRTRRLAN